MESTLCNTGSIVKTRVGARSKDGREAGLVPKQGPCKATKSIATSNRA